MKVFAVDVGYGQLAWKLRTDDRVVNMERTNIRNVTVSDIGQPVDFISIDVSFISLLKIMSAVVPLLAPGGVMVSLIKPQFEAGREHVGKGASSAISPFTATSSAASSTALPNTACRRWGSLFPR